MHYGGGLLLEGTHVDHDSVRARNPSEHLPHRTGVEGLGFRVLGLRV